MDPENPKLKMGSYRGKGARGQGPIPILSDPPEAWGVVVSWVISLVDFPQAYEGCRQMAAEAKSRYEAPFCSGICL